MTHTEVLAASVAASSTSLELAPRRDVEDELVAERGRPFRGDGYRVVELVGGVVGRDDSCLVTVTASERTPAQFDDEGPSVSTGRRSAIDRGACRRL